MGFPFQPSKAAGIFVAMLLTMAEQLLTAAAIACRDHAASHPQQQATAAAHWSTFFRSTE
jgi:hypothetical protein